MGRGRGAGQVGRAGGAAGEARGEAGSWGKGEGLSRHVCYFIKVSSWNVFNSMIPSLPCASPISPGHLPMPDEGCRLPARALCSSLGTSSLVLAQPRHLGCCSRGVLGGRGCWGDGEAELGPDGGDTGAAWAAALTKAQAGQKRPRAGASRQGWFAEPWHPNTLSAASAEATDAGFMAREV